MTITGLYFIPDTGNSTANATSASPSLLATLTDRLIKAHNPEQLGKWGLETRLMRETAASAANLAAVGSGGNMVSAAAAGGAETVSGVKVLQFLTLTHRLGGSYISISTMPSSGSTASATTPTTPQQPPAPPATVISIPHPQGREEFLGLIRPKLAPLWANFQTLDVANGIGFAVTSSTDQLHVRLGELKGKHGLRGVVVEVSIVNPDATTTTNEGGEKQGDEAAPKEDWEKGEATIRTFWESLGLKNGRAYIKVAGVGEGPASSRRLDLARQYCEMLKLRSP
ncbi:MAG: hypothetical protein M1813_005073 [Trichoglossum hirsutum]|nr:MAG: hypothetical protein M1813_005073 [Trichoglossum hirsutum]